MSRPGKRVQHRKNEKKQNKHSFEQMDSCDETPSERKSPAVASWLSSEPTACNVVRPQFKATKPSRPAFGYYSNCGRLEVFVSILIYFERKVLLPLKIIA